MGAAKWFEFTRLEKVMSYWERLNVTESSPPLRRGYVHKNKIFHHFHWFVQNERKETES